MSVEFRVYRSAVGTFLKNVTQKNPHKPDPSRGHQTLSEQLYIQVHTAS